MAIEYALHTHGPWYPNHQPLIYNEAGDRFEFPSVRPEDAGQEEAIYLNAKATIYNIIVSAVDTELAAVPVAYRNEIIDVICQSWLTKVNMVVFSQENNQIVCSLKIDLPPGAGLEIRNDQTVHYWNNGVHKQEVTNLLTTILRKLIEKAFNATSSIADVDRRVIATKNMVLDLVNQFGVVIT